MVSDDFGGERHGDSGDLAPAGAVQELPLPPTGTLVRARGDCWRVLEITRHDDCAVCRLGGVRSTNRDSLRTLLVPFDRLTPVARSRPFARAGRRAWLRQLRERLLDETHPTTLRAAAFARIDLLDYQLEPVLAVLRGEIRLLIADEVGLGKTIQAALMIAELFARDQAARCLVLAPASLCPQWLGELEGRFGLPATHVDADGLRRLASVSAPGTSVWDQLRLPVASFDFVKRPEVLDGMGARRWDALVVDEAHMAALAPERATAVGRLARRARRVILLTATPHASDSQGFQALCDIGRLPGEGPVLLFRRNRATLGLPARRRVRVLKVRMSGAERRLHDALGRYTAAVWRQAPGGSGDGDARLAMIVLRKRAASGPAALEASLSRRQRLLSSGQPSPAGWQPGLPLDPTDDVDPEDDEPGDVLGAPGLADPDVERRRLSRLLELARPACQSDRKLACLSRLLRRTREPAIVFTEYRDTLARIAVRLRGSRALATLHGGMDQASRSEAVRAFTAGEADILLATDAAAHGLNLQGRCRLVIDVELPWMPSRLEQRIGRVDRIGQARLVHAIHLVAAGTWEEQVLARLALRIGRERVALGDAGNPLGTLGEMDVARLVFASPAARVKSTVRIAAPRAWHGASASTSKRTSGLALRLDAARDMPHPGDLPTLRRSDFREMAAQEHARLERLRGLIASNRRAADDRPDRDAIAWTVVRRRRLGAFPPGLLLLFVARLVDGRGCRLDERLFLLHAALDAAACRRKSLLARTPALVQSCSRTFASVVSSAAGRCLAAERSAAHGRLAPLAAREAAIGDPCDGCAGPVQPGLFDRRAARLAEESRRLVEGDRDAAARRLDELSRGSVIELAGEPELVLVLALAD